MSALPAAHSDTAKADILSLLAYETRNNNPAKCISYGRQAITLSVNYNFIKAPALAHLSIGIGLTRLGKYKDALQELQQGLPLFKQSGNKGYVAFTYSNIGVVFYYQGNYPVALDYYFKSLKLREELNIQFPTDIENQRGMAGCYNNLGIVYKSQNDFPKALDYFFKSLKIWNKASDKGSAGMCYNNIGAICLAQNDDYKALYYFFKSLELRRQADDKRGISFSYNNIAELYIDFFKKDSAALGLIFPDSSRFGNSTGLAGFHITHAHLPDSALTLQKKALEISMQTGEKTAMISSLSGIGAALFAKQQYKEALQYFLRSYSIADSTGETDAKKNVAKNVSDIYKKLKDFEKEIYWYEKYVAFKDTIYNEEKTKEIARKSFQYDLEKKAFADSTKQAEIRNVFTEQIKQANTQRNVLYGGITLLSLLAFFVYRNLTIQKKSNSLITVEKHKTETLLIKEKQLLGEKELLLKEIHHRVKNNLQVISGLLELQKDEMTDQAVKAAFSEGQNRVRSVALIHHNLYQHENLSTISFNLFISDLVKSLADVYEEKSNRLKVELAGEDAELDIDTAVPLGLIINELLTNAYKYAFPKTGNAQVMLRLTKKDGGEYELIYTDNGPGIKGEINFDKATSLGLRLIKGLTGQLDGNVFYSFNNGSVFTFSFKDAEARKKE